MDIKQQPFRRVAVIMAGGVGERFWPMSRSARPKQLLRLLSSDRCLLEETIERIKPLIPEEDIFIITGEGLLAAIREELPNFPAENVIAEPLKRNTAPCLALATAAIVERVGVSPARISMAVFAADHYIPDAEAFRQAVDTALAHAENSDDIVTMGIRPSRPDTGYGYIEMGEKKEEATTAVVPVAAFREKPDIKTATTFLGQGKYLWNSGMFFVRIAVLWANFRTYMPPVGKSLETLRELVRNQCHLPLDTAPDGTADIFKKLPDTSIDYGIMERTSHAAVLPVNFVWDDIGSWSALTRLRTPDASGNIVVGNDALLIDSKKCVVYKSDTGEESVVALIGMENTIVALDGNAVLVCHADAAQEVKKAVTRLREQDKENFL